MSAEELKQLAGRHAAAMVETGMVVGLGSGSTALCFVQALAVRIREGLQVRCIASSRETEALARTVGVPLTTLDDEPIVDLTVDGADEIDPHLNVTKGLGGALLREKILASASRRLMIVADESKLVDQLGSRVPLAIEVVPFGWQLTARAVARFGCAVERREDKGQPLLTDNGNFNLLARFKDGIDNPHRLEQEINAIVGVVDNGLFVGRVTEVLIASDKGVRVVTRS